jgi:NitT/TauT family transport system ATP-binding protein
VSQTQDPITVSTGAASTAPAAGQRAADVLTVSDVSVGFDLPGGGRREVFTNLSFNARPGEMVVVVGKSGGGKTTLLKLLVGLVRPDSGVVEVLEAAPAAARSHMGVMLARDALIPSRNARRNVEFGLELRGVPRHRRREVAMRYLHMMELGHAEHMWPWQLSHGMRQRVALARTWALNADILLLDEPFAALDAQTRERMQMGFLNLWAEEPRTVVFVTHDLEEAILLGDRVVVIGDGKAIADIEVPMGRPRDRTNVMEDAGCRAAAAELRRLIL